MKIAASFAHVRLLFTRCAMNGLHVSGHVAGFQQWWNRQDAEATKHSEFVIQLAESGSKHVNDRQAPSKRDWETLAFQRRERLFFWCSLLENAAASEVAVNVCLPCIVCSRSGGLWQTPSETMLSVMVLALNLAGCFVEGFFKSARLLSQSLRHTQVGHQRVFVTAQGLSEGFLNVVTSFPDVAGSASSIVARSRSLLLGVAYCLLHLFGGIAVYRWGRGAGWRCAQHRWSALLRFCELWSPLMRGLLLLAFAGSFLFGPSASGRITGEPNGRARSGASMPLDLHAPGLPGVTGARIGNDQYAWSVPPLALGLLVGIFMSASGAVVATVLCTMIFPERSRPAARFATNLAATVLTLLAQSALKAAETRGGGTLYLGDCWSFVLFKFAASFCGALSAFSGTVADIADNYFGSASEDSSLDGMSVRKARLPLLSAAQNLLAHFGLTMLILLITLQSDDDAPADSPTLETPAPSMYATDGGGR